MTGRNRWGSQGSPAFYPYISLLDMDVIRRQMSRRKFDDRIVLGVASRCKWGYPQTLICNPIKRQEPFPTIFWLSCPFLVQKCGELESQQGVKDMESFLSSGVPLQKWVQYHLAHRMIKLSLLSLGTKNFFRKRRRCLWAALQSGGIGGIQNINSFNVKCLHLQMASWLGLGYHPAGTWLARHFHEIDCSTPMQQGCLM